tara:strand:- start:894 stop:1943 length:1050 start_codon:yes stop_codon:yes gene_type:complete
MFTLLPLTFFISLIVIIASYNFALKHHFVDRPSTRKQHSTVVPLSGGISIYLGSLLFLFVAVPLNNNLFYLFLTSSFIFITGLIDDLKGLTAKTRILIQIFSCLTLIFGSGLYLESFGNLFGLGEIELGLWGIPLTIFCIVGVTNAFNMIDGLDGLAGSVFINAILGIFLFQIVQFKTLYVYFFYNQFLLFLLVASIPYMIFNLQIIKGRRVFLGDSGSTFLGYIVAWSLIGLSQGDGRSIEPVDALWVIAIPLMDTIVIILRRLFNKLSPFNPDRRHLHHILLKKGISKRKTLLIISSASFVLILFGVFNSIYLSSISIFVFLIMFLLYVFWNILYFVEDVVTSNNEQ